jgi:hypothetical protein
MPRAAGLHPDNGWRQLGKKPNTSLRRSFLRNIGRSALSTPCS